MQKFFISTMGRTGSTAVINTLSKCEGLLVAQELFLPRTRKWSANDDMPIPPWSHFLENQSPLQKLGQRFLSQKLAPHFYLSQAEKHARQADPEAFGFKILSNQYEEVPGLARALKKRGYKAIYLSRRAGPRVLSGIVAKARGLYNTKDPDATNRKVTVPLDGIAEMLVVAQRSCELSKERLRNKGFDVLEIKYEDFLSSKTDFFKQVFDFLDVPERPVAESVYQVMIKSPYDVIENYDEVKAAIGDHDRF